MDPTDFGNSSVASATARDRAQRVGLRRAELDRRIDGQVSLEHRAHRLPVTRLPPRLAETGAGAVPIEAEPPTSRTVSR